MAVINKVVVKGQSYDIEDVITKKGLSTEVTRATRAEEELLFRIQGNSEESMPLTDPFKSLGSFTSLSNLKLALDELCSPNAIEARQLCGFYRAFVKISVSFSIYNSIKAFDNAEVWCQVISGVFDVKEDKLVVGDTYCVASRIGNYTGSDITWGGWEIISSSKKNKAIEDAIATEVERAISAENELSSEITELDRTINKNATEIKEETSRAKAEEQAIRQLITDLIGESPEALDTIHEISSWILNDKSGAAAMAKQISANADAIATETERAITAEEELLYRLQGKSEESSAFTDPFKNLGDFANINALQEELDKLIIPSVTNASNKGYYRATIGVILFNIVIYPTVDVLTPCSQVISGLLNVKDGVLSVTTSSSYGVAIRHFNKPANSGAYWGEWEILSSLEKNKEIENAIADEKQRAQAAEQAIRAEAAEKVEQVVGSIENGNIIAGQAREVYSIQGKADSAVFLARTQGGGATISDGVAELRQVGGNAIKVINSMDNIAAHTNAVIEKYDNFIVVYRSSFSNSIYGVRFVNHTYKGQNSHKYYSASLVYSDIDNNNIRIFINDYATSFTIKNGWNLVSAIRSVEEVKASNDLLQCTNIESEELVVANHIFIDLTEMYGAGNEPTLDECDKLFAVISYLPSGINVATPVIYESVGYNQCDTSKSMSAKTVADGVITDGANTLVAMPCLPCKLGIGENNGYIIGNGDGEEWSDASIQAVYFTPFNPQETTGDIYLQKLEPQLCEQCNGEHNVYLPPCVGYLLIETTNTDKLCAHFAWSGDRNYRDYEPYIKTEVKLPQLTQMSEWGLAGITASGTAARDTIDLENKKYIKRIGRVNLGELSWRYSNAENNSYGYSVFYSTGLKGIIKNSSSGKFGNILTLGYTIAPTFSLSSSVLPNKCIMLYISNGTLYIRDDTYTSVDEFTAALSGQYLYYELAEPEVYSIDIEGNSYIANDYGVEHFVGTSTPVSASQLFYIRKIVSELRNFLDKLMGGLGVSDPSAVANAILSVIKPSNVIEEEEV